MGSWSSVCVNEYVPCLYGDSASTQLRTVCVHVKAQARAVRALCQQRTHAMPLACSCVRPSTLQGLDASAAAAGSGAGGTTEHLTHVSSQGQPPAVHDASLEAGLSRARVHNRSSAATAAADEGDVVSGLVGSLAGRQSGGQQARGSGSSAGGWCY